MSHFSVAVLTTDESLSVDELLELYNAELTVAPYLVYTKQEAIEKGRKLYPQSSDKERWKIKLLLKIQKNLNKIIHKYKFIAENPLYRVIGANSTLNAFNP